MTQRIKIPIIGGHRQSSSLQVNNQETLNFVTAIKGAGAKNQAVLEPTPGLVSIGTAGDGACRSPQLVNWKGDLYGCFGTKIVKISTPGPSFTDVGTIDSGTSRVRIARGRDYIMIVDGTKGWSYDGTTFAEITDADFPSQFTPTAGKPTHVVYLDGFFITNDSLTDDFFISAVEDPTSWNALDFEAAAVAPDNALALAASESILYIIGDETAQLYYNSGDPDFPYDIILNATQEVGIAAAQTIAESDQGVFYLATTPEGGRFVYRIRGQQGEKISDDEIDDELAGADISSAYGYIYNQAGKSFYIIQLATTTFTLVYNINAGVWEKRGLANGDAWRASGHGILDGDNIVGSRLASTVYQLDLSVFTDDAAAVIRRRVTQVFHHNNQMMDWLELVVDIQAGVGNPTAPGDDPQMRLRYSDDGGVNWSNQLLAPMGKSQETTTRVVFRRLGISRNRIFEFEVSDQVNTTIIAAYADVRVLND